MKIETDNAVEVAEGMVHSGYPRTLAATTLGMREKTPCTRPEDSDAPIPPWQIPTTCNLETGILQSSYTLSGPASFNEAMPTGTVKINPLVPALCQYYPESTYIYAGLDTYVLHWENNPTVDLSPLTPWPNMACWMLYHNFDENGQNQGPFPYGAGGQDFVGSINPSDPRGSYGPFEITT